MGAVRAIAKGQAIIIKDTKTGEKIEVTNISKKSIRLHILANPHYKFYDKRKGDLDVNTQPTTLDSTHYPPECSTDDAVPTVDPFPNRSYILDQYKLTPDAPSPKWWYCSTCGKSYRAVHALCLTCRVDGVLNPQANPILNTITKCNDVSGPTVSYDPDVKCTTTEQLYPQSGA